MKSTTHSRPLTACAGLSVAASMLLAGCGGSDAPPAAAGPAAGPTAAPIVQPAWASMGVLVAPGQASKTIALTNCVGEGSGEGAILGELYNASVTVFPNGNVSFKAARTEGGTASELIAISLAETTERVTQFSAAEGSVRYISYEYQARPQDQEGRKEIILEAGEGRGLYAYQSNETSWSEVRCDDNSFANLTPAAAFLPSEQRAASAFLAGTTAADFRQYGPEYVARLIDGVFSWANSPLNVPGADEADLRTASTINIASGQLFKGVLSESGNGLGSSPAPVRVTYSAALQSGDYSESFYAANRETPSYRGVEVQISYPQGMPDRFELSRVDNFLLAGRFFSRFEW